MNRNAIAITEGDYIGRTVAARQVDLFKAGQAAQVAGYARQAYVQNVVRRGVGVQRLTNQINSGVCYRQGVSALCRHSAQV